MSQKETTRICLSAINRRWYPHTIQLGIRSIRTLSAFSIVLMLMTIGSIRGAAAIWQETGRGEESARGRSELATLHFQEIGERVRSGGTIPVIVRLRVKSPIRTRVAVDGDSPISIRQLQNEVLNGLVGYDPASIRQFKEIPYLAVRVNQTGVEYLRTSSLVADIREDGVIRSTGQLSAGSRLGAVAGQTIAVIGNGIERGSQGLIAVPVFSKSSNSEICAGTGGADCLAAFDSELASALERIYDMRSGRPITAIALSLSGSRLVANCDEDMGAIKAMIDLLRDAGIPTIVDSEEKVMPGSLSAPACISSVLSVKGSEKIGELAAQFTLVRALVRDGLPKGTAIEQPAGISGRTSQTSTLSLPANPGSLLGTAISTSQISLNWVDNATNETGFIVRRKIGSDGTWEVAAMLPQNTLIYLDKDLFPGKTYYYRVNALNADGESGASNETIVTLPIYDFILYSNGVTLSNSITTNRFNYYRLSVPAGASQLLIQTNGSGNADLYVRYGNVPTIFTFDCRSILDTSSDRCVFSYPAAGDWYIMVYGNSRSVVNYSLNATYLMGTVPNTPTPPTNLKATATSSTQINLSWSDNSTNEAGFTIRRKAGSTGTWVEVVTVGPNVTTHFDTGLMPDTTYYYSVLAFNNAGRSVFSNDANAMTPGQLTARPVAPGNLVATLATGLQINLTWSDNSTNETGFIIRRMSETASVWSIISTVGANVTSFQDTQVTTGTTYAYTVSAVNTAGESSFSNEARAITGNSESNVALPPINLQGTAMSTSMVDLAWADNSVNELGFRIRRKAGEDGQWILIAILKQNETSFVDAGLSPGIDYYYNITSYNAYGESAASNEVAVTLPIYAFTQLESGVAISHTVGRLRTLYYRIHVPIGTSELLVQTKGIGSTDMYVRAGLQPNTFYYNCRSLSDTTNNRCLFLNPTPGDWHIMITSTSAMGSNYQLTATNKMGASSTVIGSSSLTVKER